MNLFFTCTTIRSHLRDIRDRSVLRVIEKSDGITGLSTTLGPITSGVSSVSSNWEDQSYFSEPEFDSEFQHQHIHKSKVSNSQSAK